MIWLVIILLLILFYTWVIYPAVLLSFPRRLQNARKPESWQEVPVAVILSAYNEEEHLAERLHNLLKLNYPATLVQIYVGLDGCSDRSAEVIQGIATQHTNIHISDFSGRRGKVAVLKDLVKSAINDNGKDVLLLFTDANTMFRQDALIKMLPYFNDDNIGGVCGRLIFIDKEGNAPESSYWQLETGLKIAESAIDSCLGANGAIYIMRAVLFWQDIPDNTLIDDFVLGMKIREQGYRLIYEPEAIAEEILPEQTAEWTRRVRIGAGGYQALKLCGNCLRPHYRSFAAMFWSHKVLRWFTPHIILLLFICLNAVIFSFNKKYAIPFFVFEVIMVIIIAGIFVIEQSKSNNIIVRICWMLRHFIVMQTALFVGFIRFCRGGLKGYWTRTPRQKG